MPSQKPKILLMGATGYVGGSVLHHLLAHPDLTSTITPSNPITLPIRPGNPSSSPSRAELLTATYGSRVRPVHITSLDDAQTLTRLASQHDLVINAASGFHPSSAEALVLGLAQRRKTHHRPGTPTTPWMIHTSGTSNIADRPLSGVPRPDVEHDDANSQSVFAFEEAENRREWYPQRAAELVVLRTASETGVSAASIQAPCIFGTGSGLFNRAGLMVPVMMSFVLQHGFGIRVGDGSGCIDTVHVSDLADLYVLCVRDIVHNSGANVPSGTGGIIFPAVGRTLTAEIPKKCLDVAFATGNLPLEDGPQSPEIREWSIEDAAVTTAGNVAVAETGYAGHRKTKGTVARERLGWAPVYLEEAWEKDFETELRAALNGQRGSTMAACIANTK